MDGLLWSLKSNDFFSTFSPILISFIITYIIFQSDYIPLLLVWFYKLTFGNATQEFVSGLQSVPEGLVIIPSLLRNKEDYAAIIMAVDSCAMNGYPNKLVIVASVDGNTDNPQLYKELVEWGASRSYPKNVHIHVMGSPNRCSKIMAIDAATQYMEKLVADGVHEKFPTVYFSADGDGILSPNALEKLAIKLHQTNAITGNPHRVVSGNICIRKDLIWHGWKNFFSIKGQIHVQCAREFITLGVSRYNWKTVPRAALSGALYVTWSELLIQAPKYMGYLQTLRFTDYIKWLFGRPLPSFANCNAPPLPEALTGGTDDTSMAYLSTISRWRNGKLTFEPPKTIAHSIIRLFEEWIIDRSHGYEPTARVYTFTPQTIKGLWNQRVRWNAARFECSIRFMKAMFVHIDLFSVVGWQLIMIVRAVVTNVACWVLIPLLIFKTNGLVSTLVMGYAIYTVSVILYLSMSLILEREAKHYWQVLLCIPFSIPYQILFGAGTMVYGNVRDVLFFGNQIRFVPEETLIKGKSQRIAVLYRVRRFFSMLVRSIRYGDVPFGAWWFGFREQYPYVESGYKHWTSGKRSEYLLK